MSSIENWFAYLEERALDQTGSVQSRHSVLAYQRDMRLFAKWFAQTNGEDVGANTLTATDVSLYKQHLQTVQQQQAATINRKLVTISQYGAWLVATGVWISNPLADVSRVKKTKVAKPTLKRKDVNRIFRELEKQILSANTPKRVYRAKLMACAFKFLGYTGLRISELVALQPTHIQMSEKKGVVFVRSGKGDKDRDVPLNREARAALRGLLEIRPESDWLFCKADGSQSSVRMFQNAFGEISQRSGVKFTPHTLRAYLITQLNNAGQPLKHIQNIAGHARPETTLSYVMVTEQDLENTMAVLD